MPGRAIPLIVLALLFPSFWGSAQTVPLPIVVPGTGGSAGGTDGPLAPLPGTALVEIDLGDAQEGPWDMPGSGSGVYDPNKWAVVFKYSEVNIPVGCTVRFINRESSGNPPVVFLVSGDVVIDGQLTLDGQNWTWGADILRNPGPGGFRGGYAQSYGPNGVAGGAGFGPGGGHGSTCCGGSGTYAYGNQEIIPLIGGSGGGTWARDSATPTLLGGAGGGAILIAATGTISINGGISARGGDSYSWWSMRPGAGSGGAIRLIAADILGSGALYATEGALSPANAGHGRIRIETPDQAPSTTLVNGSLPAPSIGGVDLATRTAVLWPEDIMPDPPSVTITDIGGMAVPSDPGASLDMNLADVFLHLTGPTQVRIRTTDLDPAVWSVTLRLVPKLGTPVNPSHQFIAATLDTNTIPPPDFAQSDWTAEVDLNDNEQYVFQAIAERL